jgi:hypothetical protein
MAFLRRFVEQDHDLVLNTAATPVDNVYNTFASVVAAANARSGITRILLTQNVTVSSGAHSLSKIEFLSNSTTGGYNDITLTFSSTATITAPPRKLTAVTVDNAKTSGALFTLSGTAALSLENAKLTASGSTAFFAIGANTLNVQASGKSLIDFSTTAIFSLLTAGGIVNLDLHDGSSYINGIVAGTDGNFNVTIYGSGVRTATLTGYTGTVSVVNTGSSPRVFGLTDGATIAVDASKGPNYSVTIAGNRTLGNPTNGVAGQELTIAVIQDATGSRVLAFDTNWSAVDAGVSVNPAANSVSIISAWLYGSTWYYTLTHAAESGSGEANTASNVGTGAGWFKQKTSLDLEFKSALAGYGFSVSAGTNENTLSIKTTVTTLTDGASIAVNADLGPHYMVTLGGNRTLANPTNAAVGKVLEIAVAQDGTGGRTLAFDTDFIAADSTVTINPTASAISLIRAIARDFGGGVKWYYTVTYVGDPSSGEANTASNVGTGTGVFKQKSGVDLEFKSLLAGFGLSVSGGTNEVTLAEKLSVTTLTDAATVAVDADLGPNFMLTVAGNRTLGNPTNSAVGKYLVLAVSQDGTGGRTLAFDTNFVNVGNLYQIAQTASAASVITAQARDFGGGVKWYYAITHGESTYQVSPSQLTAVAATGTLTATGNFSNGDTVTTGTKTYTFQTTLTNVNGNVLIGASASDSLDNLITAINLGAGSGTLYAAATTANGFVSAAAGAGDTMNVTALVAGSAANTTATTETSATASWGGSTLSGGAEDTVDYNPTGLSAATTLRLSTDASHNLHGVVGTAAQGRKRVINTGSFNLVIKHQSASSSAANRFICPGSSDITLTPDDSVEVEYDKTATRWRLV